MTLPRPEQPARTRTCKFCGSPGQFGVLLDHEHLDPDWAEKNGYADEVAAWREAAAAALPEWVSDLQSRVAKQDNAYARAKELVRGSPVDWTDDPGSQEPDGWWKYTSQNNRDVIAAAVRDATALPDVAELAAILESHRKIGMAGVYLSPLTPRPHGVQPMTSLQWAAAILAEIERGRGSK